MELTSVIEDAWGWVGIKPAQVLGDNSFGNLLIKDEVGLYWRLCPEDLYCKVVANNRAELDSPKAFEHLLYDSINLLYLAHDIDRDTDQNDVERACARGSIMSTLLLFECAANCCLEALSMSRGFAGDLDKLPFLSKLEFFATQHGGTLDRGRHEVAAAAELKSLRDGYVHPKTLRKPITQVAPGHYEAESPKTAQLAVPRDPGGWHREQAVTVAKAANSFLGYYFLEVCRFSPATVCSVLLEPSKAEIPCHASVTIDCIGGLDRAVQELGLGFEYLGKGA